MTERALETDTAVREADLRGVLAFLQIRHGAWLTAASDNPHRSIYAEARDSAIREVLWRFEQAGPAAIPAPVALEDPDAGEPQPGVGKRDVTPAERAVRDAAQAVEMLPPDVRLTRAAVLLGQAQEAVAEYVHGEYPDGLAGPSAALARYVAAASTSPAPLDAVVENAQAERDACEPGCGYAGMLCRVCAPAPLERSVEDLEGATGDHLGNLRRAHPSHEWQDGDCLQCGVTLDDPLAAARCPNDELRKSAPLEGKEPPRDPRVRADRIFAARVMGWLARSYGEEMEHPACPEVLRAAVHEHTALEDGEDFAAIRGTVDKLLEQVAFAHVAPEGPDAGEPQALGAAIVFEPWRAVGNELPEPGRLVLAFYRNDLGNSRTVRAVYAKARTLQADPDEDSTPEEWRDQNGEWWWPAGWYETPDAVEGMARIPTPTHWMPLPPRPGSSAWAHPAPAAAPVEAGESPTHAVLSDLMAEVFGEDWRERREELGTGRVTTLEVHRFGGTLALIDRVSAALAAQPTVQAGERKQDAVRVALQLDAMVRGASPREAQGVPLALVNADVLSEAARTLRSLADQPSAFPVPDARQAPNMESA